MVGIDDVGEEDMPALQNDDVVDEGIVPALQNDDGEDEGIVPALQNNDGDEEIVVLDDGVQPVGEGGGETEWFLAWWKSVFFFYCDVFIYI